MTTTQKRLKLTLHYCLASFVYSFFFHSLDHKSKDLRCDKICFTDRMFNQQLKTILKCHQTSIQDAILTFTLGKHNAVIPNH